MLDNFTFLKFKFFLNPLENIKLSSFKGSTLRGGFGHTFRKIVCLKRDLQSCQECPLNKVCVYSLIFETSPPLESTKLRKIKTIPKPFVIEYPVDGSHIFNKGEILQFNLILIGKVIDYLPYFIFTFEELGKKGLGRGKGKYELNRVDLTRYEYHDEDRKDQTVYSGKDKSLLDIGHPTTWKDIVERSFSAHPNNVHLHFMTPARIKYNNKLLDLPEFHHITRALLHRISALSYFHCGQELEVDFRGLVERAKNIRRTYSDLRWTEFERYSTRQRTRMKLGGFTGKVSYQGEISEFLPFLLLGELIHIGKSCTFGFGMYRMDFY